MIESVHSGQMGVDKSLKRARDIMFWPKMSAEIRAYVLSCTTCLEHRYENPKEPLQSHPVPERPWQTIACDLFSWDNKDYLVTVCYYSRYFEVDLLQSTSSESVIRKLKKIFSNQGIPENLISDNGPQFSSQQFPSFARDWDFTHCTSSPYHAQSNGLAEKYVQFAKHLFDKAKADKRDPYISLLEYRNCPLECGYSPSQLLNSRRYRSVLPSTHQQLLPKVVDRSKVKVKLEQRHVRQKHYFDKGSKNLKPLEVGESVRLKHNNKTWQSAVVTEKHSNRSYIVETEAGNCYRRNRRFLQKTGEHHKFDNSHDIQPFDAKSSTHLSSPQKVQSNLDQAEQPCTDQNTYVDESSQKLMSSQKCSRESNQPYITRAGRKVKPKTNVSM